MIPFSFFGAEIFQGSKDQMVKETAVTIRANSMNFCLKPELTKYKVSEPLQEFVWKQIPL
jgi:hypothetical protein